MGLPRLRWNPASPVKGAPMPYVKVEIAKGIATVEQKRAVIKGMTDVLVRELGRNPEYIFVVIDEVDTDNWGRRGMSLTELWQESQAGSDE
jgi:4-oxalocrotonate tautomerase